MNKRLIAAIASIGLVIVIAIVWFGFREDSDETHRVGRGSIDVTIQTIGRVQSTGSTTIRTQQSGEVDIVAVQPGDRVVEGDVLIQLAPEPLRRAIQSAERQLQEAEFALQTAEREADDIPEDENRRFAVVQAGQRVEAAQIVLDDAEKALVQASIRSPRDGIVLEVPVRSGDLINRSAPVAIMYAPEDLEVIANVDELDLVNVDIGADVRIRLDAIPGQEIAGTVVATAPAAIQQGGATVFPTTIRLDDVADIDIRPGMNADVTIVTEERTDVLLIPQRAVRAVGDRSFVDVVTDEGRQEREIIIGYRSAGQAEVVSGLAEGETIVLP
jgi:HlyD family secretion protein